MSLAAAFKVRAVVDRAGESSPAIGVVFRYWQDAGL
jgi:hypothetical protein